MILSAVLLLGIFLPAVEGHAAAATLVKQNGTWYYMQNGKVINTTTLVKYNGSWWYVVNGKLASNTTTLFKYNGLWYYVKEGRVDFNADTLVPFNGGWYYVNNGTIDNQSTTYVSYNGKWYYVNKGKVNLRSQILRSPQTEFYHYNSEGQLLYSTLGDWDTYYSYDSQGRVDRVFLYYADQKYMEWNEDYTYNADGSYRVDYFDEGCSEERYHTADGKIRNSIIYDSYCDDYDVLTYTYNSLGDLKKINAKLYWESGYQEYNKTYSYVYNSRNKPISRTEYVDGDFEYAEYYVYDAQGRVIRTLWKDNYDTFLTTHTYNQSGQLMWETTYVV